MSVETEVQVQEQPVKRGRGRPPKKTVDEPSVTRENRVPVGGFRDILTVEGKDPAYHYRFVLGEDEKDMRIYSHQNAGYTFAKIEDGLKVGQSAVFKSDSVGSLIRVPNKDGRWLYLMKIPVEWYEDDQRSKAHRVDETEKSLREIDEGMYGQQLDIKRSH